MNLLNAGILTVASDADLSGFALGVYLSAGGVAVFLAWVKYWYHQVHKKPTKSERFHNIFLLAISPLTTRIRLFSRKILCFLLQLILIFVSLFQRTKKAKEGDICHHCTKGFFQPLEDNFLEEFPLLEVFFSKKKLACSSCKSTNLEL